MTRLRGNPSSPPRRVPMVEPLELRRFACATCDVIHAAPAVSDAVVATVAPSAEGVPPTLLNVTIQGEPDKATAVVLTFSESLDPSRAQRVGNYRISRITKTDDGAVLDSTPFGGSSDQKEEESIAIDTAIYDDATRTVTLVPHGKFKADVRLRRVRVSADADTGVTSATGVRLDGNNNGTPGGSGVFKVRFKNGNTVTYVEEDGDKVKVKLKGPGKLSVQRHIDGKGNTVGGASQLFLTDDPTSRSVLTGTVRRGKNGDGIATIGQLVHPGAATISIATDPAFVIGEVVP